MKNDGEEIAKRLDNIEEILRMLLISNVLNDSADRILNDSLEKVKKIIEPYGLEKARWNNIEGKYFIFAELHDRISGKKIVEMYEILSEKLKKIKLVIVFEHLHFKTKQVLEQHSISYYVDGKLKVY